MPKNKKLKINIGGSSSSGGAASSTGMSEQQEAQREHRKDEKWSLDPGTLLSFICHPSQKHERYEHLESEPACLQFRPFSTRKKFRTWWNLKINDKGVCSGLWRSSNGPEPLQMLFSLLRPLWSAGRRLDDGYTRKPRAAEVSKFKMS